jgi:hypothetical protein
MTFDEQLKGAFDTITGLMREEISRQAQIIADESSESARTDRERAVSEARDEAERDARQREAAAVAEARETADREARQREAAAVAEARETAEREARQREATAVAEAREAVEHDALQREATAVALAETRGREQGQDEGRRQAEESARAATDAALAARPVESPRPDGSSNERLVEAVRSISDARSLSEVLHALLNSVGREAARAGVLLVRGGHVQGWRFVGFDPAIEPAQSLTVSLDAGGLIAEAVRTNAAVNNVGGEVESAPVFAALPSGRECLAVPIALGGQVVAVLYADQGSTDAAPVPAWMDAVEVLVRHAARSLEAFTAFKAARAVMARGDSSEATGSGAGDVGH